MGIEPTCPAWKAGALPLSYTRPTLGLNRQTRQQPQTAPTLAPNLASKHNDWNGGGGSIRTYVDVRRHIYSLLPLTTRPPLRPKISESEAKQRNIGFCSPMSTLIG